MANKEISVAIRAKDYATAAFEKVRATVSSIKDQTVRVRANTNAAQSAVQSVKDKIAGIRDKVVNVRVNTTGAEANVAGVNSSLTEFATKAGLAAIAVTALQSALSAGKSAFVDYNAELEQTRVAFTSMLGSADQANTMIANLQKFAAETPFEMPGVRDAAQQLLAFGYDANEIIPTLTALGNAASGLGRGQDGFNHLAFVFGQIRTTGQLMGQDVMQLAQLGVPVKDILAKNLGLTKEELARIGEQGIDADIAIKALIDGMNERFPEMMKKQSETFEGVLSNIKDNLGQAFGLSGLPLFEDAKNMLLEIKNITDTMLANAQGGKSLFAGILPDDLLEKASAFGETIKKSLKDAAPAAETLVWTAGKLADVFLDVGNIALTALRPIIPIATRIQSVVYGAIGVIASILDTVLEVVLMVQTNVADSWDYIYDITADLWNDATEIVGDFCTAAIEFIAGVVAKIDEIVSPVVDIFADAFQAAADFVYDAMETATGYVRNFIAWVEEAIAAVKELAIVKAASDLIGSASDSVEVIRARGRAYLGTESGGSARVFAGDMDGDFDPHYRSSRKAATFTHAEKDRKAGRGSRSGINAAEREAKRLAEKIESVTEKVRQSVTSLAHDIVSEVGTTYEKGMDVLQQKTEQMQAQIKEASDLGIDTTALHAKLDEYANIVKEKVTKAWREANEDLRSETALTWAQVNKDARAEAEATYQIGVTKLNREKENRLKEVALTRDSAEARVAVEQWAAAEMARLDQQRVEAMRKSPLTTQEALRATLEEQYERLRDAGAQMKEMTDSLFTSMADGFTSGFQNVLTDGFKGIQDAFSNMLKNMLNAIVKFVMNQMITRWLSMILPGFGGGIPATQASTPVPGYAGARATGGPVAFGRAYLVGERGPEIFRPTQSGRILNSLSSSGGTAPNIRVIVNNNTNERMTGTAETKFNGSEWVTTIMIDAIATNRNGMRDVIKGAV